MYIEIYFRDSSCTFSIGIVTGEFDMKELDVPQQYRSMFEKLVLQNIDVFARKDSKLGNTEAVKFDVGNDESIKLRPYGTLMKKRD